MVKLKLKSHVYNKIHLDADLKLKNELKIKSQFSFGVDYNDDNSTCIARLKLEATSAGSDELKIDIECRGLFECEGIKTDDDKKQAHIMAYHYLFPYAQSMATQLFVNAGLAPFIINISDMRPEDIIIGQGKKN